MTWQPTLLDDGDNLSTKLNAVVADGVTELNAIGNNSLRDGTFRGVHGGGIVSNLYTVEASNSTEYTYTQTTFGSSIVYSSYGNDVGTDDVGSLGTGDRIIVGHPSSSSPAKAQILFSTEPEIPGMGNAVDPEYQYAGCWLLGNTEVVEIDPGDYSDVHVVLSFRVRFGSSSANWRTIQVSERAWSLDDHVGLNGGGTPFTNIDMDCSIRTFVGAGSASFYSLGSEEIQAAQMMFSLRGTGGTSGLECIIRHWNMSALFLYAKDPS